MIHKSLIALGLLGLAASVGQPAFAGTRTVRYTDLDLMTQIGQATLDVRLQAAAKAVCRGSFRDVTDASVKADRECFASALADARRAKTKITQTAMAAL